MFRIGLTVKVKNWKNEYKDFKFCKYLQLIAL